MCAGEAAVAFSVQDFHDLVRLLAERPEWRMELRPLILTEELLSLPAIVQRLAKAQERTEERLGRLEAAVTALAEGESQRVMLAPLGGPVTFPSYGKFALHVALKRRRPQDGPALHPGV